LVARASKPVRKLSPGSKDKVEWYEVGGDWEHHEDMAFKETDDE